MSENNDSDGAPQRAVSRHTALIKLGVASLVVLLLLAGFKGWRDFTYVRSQEAALAAKIADTEERIDALKERIGRIKKDPASLEQIAREELAWVRDGDVVIVLPQEEKKAAAARR